MTVELKERNGVHLVGFLKNGVKSGSPLQLEYPGMATGRRQGRVLGAASGTDKTVKWRLLISTMPTGGLPSSIFGGTAQGVGNQQHAVQFSLMRREPDRDSDETPDGSYGSGATSKQKQNSTAYKGKTGRKRKEGRQANRHDEFAASDWAAATASPADLQATAWLPQVDDY
eukprot:COSAG02_NODE_701_length_18335_cov_18.672955_10_plen_171_part_00